MKKTKPLLKKRVNLKTLMPNAKAIIADEMKTYMIQGEGKHSRHFLREAKMLRRMKI